VFGFSGPDTFGPTTFRKKIFMSAKHCARLYFRFILLAISLLFFAHPMLAAASERVGSDTSFDFGGVKQGERIVHTFYIKNALAVPIKIAHIDLSAPGMTTRAKPVIDPGETGEIEIAWNTSRVVQEVAAKATVHFVGDLRPDLTFVLSGIVTAEIEAIPLAGFFISLFKDESAENTITLINHRDHPLVISKVDGPSSLFRASLENPTPGQIYKLSVKVPAGTQPGRYAEIVNLETNDASNPAIRIPVNVFVKDVIYASQNIVEFGDINLAQLQAYPELLQTFTNTVVIRKRGGEYEIKSVISDVRGVRVTRTPGSASQSFEIQIGLETQALRAGPIAGTVRILTSDAAVPELTIAVRGNVK
jgi:Protein of unknown function (DUF1573)